MVVVYYYVEKVYLHMTTYIEWLSALLLCKNRGTASSKVKSSNLSAESYKAPLIVQYTSEKKKQFQNFYVQ